MRAVIAMARSTDLIGDHSQRSTRPGFVDRARDVWAICSRANDAAHTWEELNALSDDELARRGLRRADVARIAFDKLTARA